VVNILEIYNLSMKVNWSGGSQSTLYEIQNGAVLVADCLFERLYTTKRLIFITNQWTFIEQKTLIILIFKKKLTLLWHTYCIGIMNKPKSFLDIINMNQLLDTQIPALLANMHCCTSIVNVFVVACKLHKTRKRVIC
jgi:lysophospholipid acyltransferase (LPLAT)-like uncharacterized protein